ncbi:MAG: Lrp/AsnC family transcriptional regulator [Candidatus Micrarchaeota archaeon]
MPERLDVKDERILTALSINARQSLSSIGRKVGLSEEVVNYRLRNLIKRDVIAKITVELDSFKLGYKAYRLYIRLEGANAKKEQEIYSYLKNMRGADWIAACEGKYNLVFRFMVEDEFGLNRILNDISDKFSSYIRERDLTIPLEWHFYHAESGVFHPGGPKYGSLGGRKRVKVDEKDLKILSILSEDARTPSSKIAGQVGLTPNAVKYRLKRLEKERIITGYEVMVDRTKIGTFHYKLLVHFRGANEEKVKRFVRYCEELPNLVFLVRAIGSWDMDIDLDFKNTVELHNSVLELASKFKDLVRNYETLSIFKSDYCNPLKEAKKIERG